MLLLAFLLFPICLAQSCLFIESKTISFTLLGPLSKFYDPSFYRQFFSKSVLFNMDDIEKCPPKDFVTMVRSKNTFMTKPQFHSKTFELMEQLMHSESTISHVIYLHVAFNLDSKNLLEMIKRSNDRFFLKLIQIYKAAISIYYPSFHHDNLIFDSWGTLKELHPCHKIKPTILEVSFVLDAVFGNVDELMEYLNHSHPKIQTMIESRGSFALLEAAFNDQNSIAFMLLQDSRVNIEKAIQLEKTLFKSNRVMTLLDALLTQSTLSLIDNDLPVNESAKIDFVSKCKNPNAVPFITKQLEKKLSQHQQQELLAFMKMFEIYLVDELKSRNQKTDWLFLAVSNHYTDIATFLIDKHYPSKQLTIILEMAVKNEMWEVVWQGLDQHVFSRKWIHLPALRFAFMKSLTEKRLQKIIPLSKILLKTNKNENWIMDELLQLNIESVIEILVHLHHSMIQLTTPQIHFLLHHFKKACEMNSLQVAFSLFKFLLSHYGLTRFSNKTSIIETIIDSMLESIFDTEAWSILTKGIPIAERELGFKGLGYFVIQVKHLEETRGKIVKDSRLSQIQRWFTK